LTSLNSRALKSPCRLQDAKALQAFREEAFLNARMTQEFLPDQKALIPLIWRIWMVLENMLRKMFGGKIPERTETNASPTQTNDEQYATRFW